VSRPCLSATPSTCSLAGRRRRVGTPRRLERAVALRTPLPPPLLPVPTIARSLEEHVTDDNAKLSAAEVHSYLTRVMYNRRNKMNPLWNTLLVAGVKDAQRCVANAAGRGRAAAAGGHSACWDSYSTPLPAPSCRSVLSPRSLLPARARSYLGFVDLYGTSFSENYAATGFGNHLALPLIRDRCVDVCGGVRHTALPLLVASG
jgi:hypothetical protein